MWCDFQGKELEWRDPRLSNFCLTLRCSAENPAFVTENDEVFIVFNRSIETASVLLPETNGTERWIRAIDTAHDQQHTLPEVNGETVTISGQSVVAFALTRLRETQ